MLATAEEINIIELEFAKTEAKNFAIKLITTKAKTKIIG